MRNPIARYLLIVLAVVAMAGCSTSKDAFLNRTFHRLVTRDNSWFNANERLNEAVAAMQKAHVDDYDEVLPIFVNGTAEEARALVPEMEICIEKCATVIDRNSMEFGGKEKNNWVPEAWFVIGKSHFYKRGYLDAARTFDYVGRRYKGHDKQMEAKLWLARTSIGLEQYARAQTTLDEITGQKKLPKKFPHDQLSAVQADLYLHRGRVDNGITSLEHAVSIAKAKKDRIRWSFILAQLYQMKGQQEKAIALYNKVAHMGPPYEMGFHAQIFQALALGHGDTKALRQKLTKMLRDEKHRDHFDMIHYAMAELDLRDNLKEDAIAQLKLSTHTSTVDTRQKAKSFLKLADLYFDDKKYPAAQQYYDSTSTLLTEEHPRFDEVTTRAEVLGDLVEQLNIIAREDSLQAFAKLDPEEREKRIRRMIKERERQEELDKQAAEDARDLLANAPATPGKTGGQPGAGGAWYFYNPTQIARGMADFKKKWGNRANDDDWRRADKSGSALVDIVEEEGPETTASTGTTETGEPEWKNPESYLKDIPVNEAMLDSSNAHICKALYISGMIYKEKLKDVDNAIESFQVLNDRFEDCRYTPESYYQLYRIYLAKEQAGNFMDFGGASSKHYADIVLERWPGSEFARLVQNPDQLQADEANRLAEDQAYQDLYALFKQGAYRGVIATCEGVLASEPRNHLLPKYALLKAMAIGGLRLMGPFREALTYVRDTYEGSEEATAAAALLASLEKTDKAGEETTTPPPAAKETSYAQAKGEHYVIIIIPEAAGPIDPIKAAISNFNQRFFRNQAIEVKNSMWTGKDQVVMMRLFQTKELAMTYYDLFKNNKGDLAGINDQGYPLLVISSGNYPKFYVAKDTEGYTDFFDRNYLSGK
ncbi:MAG TPA: hypothetical protein PKD45_02060 [Flavobacteriales bacterium]|nr:hypothetical protein [Flavobacteriales bacterium]